jgi:hypothetical protein
MAFLRSVALVCNPFTDPVAELKDEWTGTMKTLE